jgi:hypothetical protein
MSKSLVKEIRTGFVGVIIVGASMLVPVPRSMNPLAAEAAVVAPVWLAPAVDLIKYLVGVFKPNNEQKKQVNNKASDMQTAATKLAPYPRFLSDSREFRIAALNLAQTVVVGARSDTIADKVWQLVGIQYTDANTKFGAAFKSDSVRDLIAGDADLQSAESQCDNSLAQIHQELTTMSATATPKDKQDALTRLISSADSLAQGAQMPEYIMVQNTDDFVKGYGQVATDIKNSTNPPKPSNSESIERLNSEVFVKVSLAGSQTEKPTKDSSEQPDFLKQMHEDIQKKVEPPAWSQVLIENAGTSTPSSWLFGGAFGGGVVLSLLGVGFAIRFRPDLLQKVGLLR